MFQTFREDKPLPADQKDWFDPLKPKKKKPLQLTPQDAEQAFLKRTQELRALKEKNKEDSKTLQKLTTDVQSIENKKLNTTVEFSKVNNTKKNQEKMSQMQGMLHETMDKLDKMAQRRLEESKSKCQAVKDKRVTGDDSTKVVKAINHVKLLPALDKEIKIEMARNQEMNSQIAELSKTKDDKSADLNKTVNLLNTKKEDLEKTRQVIAQKSKERTVKRNQKEQEGADPTATFTKSLPAK